MKGCDADKDDLANNMIRHCNATTTDPEAYNPAIASTTSSTGKQLKKQKEEAKKDSSTPMAIDVVSTSVRTPTTRPLSVHENDGNFEVKGPVPIIQAATNNTDSTLSNISSDSTTDTLDLSLSTISDGDFPYTPDLTHVSLFQSRDDGTCLTARSKESFSTVADLHVTSESSTDDDDTRFDDYSDMTHVSRIDTNRSLFDELDSSSGVKGGKGNFMASTPRRKGEEKEEGVSKPASQKERTIFEEIVETQTEIVVESTYEVETNTEQISKEILRIPTIVKDLVVDSHPPITKPPCNNNESNTKFTKDILDDGGETPLVAEVEVAEEELNDPEDETTQDAPPSSLDESTLSLADADVLDTTMDLKEAIINEQSEPLNVAKALLKDKNLVTKRGSNVRRSNSWKFSSDYKLSRKSTSLIESIEFDMEDETMNDLDPAEDKMDENVQEMLDVRANLRHVEDGKKTNKNSKPSPPKLYAPRKLKPKSKDREWKSKSLHSIFTDHTETDIDNVDDKELMDILKR